VSEHPFNKLKPRGKPPTTTRAIESWIMEVAADEAGAGDTADTIEAPSLAYFGVNTPPTTAGIVVSYQVAQ